MIFVSLLSTSVYLFMAIPKRLYVLFSLLHSDVWGRSNVTNVSKFCWFIVFIDDCTRASWVYVLKQKSDVSSVIQTFFYMIKNQFGVQPKWFRSDNTQDYFHQTLISFFQKRVIFLCGNSTTKWSGKRKNRPYSVCVSLEVMRKMGYKQSQGDNTLFIKHSAAGGVTALIVYLC